MSTQALKDQLEAALLMIDRHGAKPDVTRLVQDLMHHDSANLRDHAGEILNAAKGGPLGTLRNELAVVLDRLEHEQEH
jgi:hypothetical protein